MRDVKFEVRDAVIDRRMREIHQSWSPAVRHRRAEEGRQRREEFVQLILNSQDSRHTNILREATIPQRTAI